MLGFKQYAILTCQVAFEERARSHFLRYIGPDLFLYLQDNDFLSGMTSKDGVKTTGIQYYVNEIDKDGSIYNELYNKFIGPLGLDDNIKYYRVAAYYLKKLKLTLKEENVFITKTERANNAIKEIFAENLYDYMVHLNGTQAEKEDLATIGVKNAVKKTFVPDSLFTSAHQSDSGLDATPSRLTSLLEWNDPKLFPSIERPTNKHPYERNRSPVAKSLLYTNNTFTFEKEIFSPLDPNEKLTDIEIDAAITYPSSKKTYFFSGDDYYRYNDTTKEIDSGYPKKISDNWPGLPNNIDAATVYSYPNTTKTELYFFKGDQYYLWDQNKNKVYDGYPKPISIWNGVPNDLDAALELGSNNQVYFFKGDKYWKYDKENNKVLPESPLKIKDEWGGMPDNISAAFTWQYDGVYSYNLGGALVAPKVKNQTYFFKGNKYTVYDDSGNKPNPNKTDLDILAGWKFPKEIFSVDPNKIKKNTAFGLSQIPQFKDTLKPTKFTTLLAQGAYVEFFFKYDIQELVENLTSSSSAAKALLQHLQKHCQSPLNPNYTSAFRPTIPADITAGGKEGVGLFEATQYHSLRSFALLVNTLYQYSRENVKTTFDGLTGNNASLPRISDIDKAIKDTKIEFGARLVISTPALSEQVNSSKITPWPGITSAGNNTKIYNSQFDGNKIAEQHGGVVVNALDGLINDSEDIQIFISGFKNKTFVYNLVEINTTAASLNNFAVATAYCFPIAEVSNSITETDKQKFLTDFYSDILKYKTKYTTYTEIQNKVFGWKLKYMDYAIEQAVIKKYYQIILNKLFEQDLPKKFFESQLVGKRYLQLLNKNSYRALVKGESEKASLFQEKSSDRDKFLEECDKTDDKTDTNLITLIESIEEV
tara:strand:+ start:7245 stop:9869 length:2625 start_codon:yes stop_codon:yes gene_type:complete